MAKTKRKERFIMEMCYNSAMVLPSNYASISSNEMVYLTGGLNISYQWTYQTKIGAAVKAASVKSQYGWGRISTYDLAAEIFVHAVAYYRFGLVLAVARKLGFATSIANSILGGIDVQNGLDTARIAGVQRYHFYRVMYAAL